MEQFPDQRPSQDLAFWILAAFSCTFYAVLSWLVSGGQDWWILDIISGYNVFYGDDAYRYFLAKSAFSKPELYTYNFVLPVALFLDGALSFALSGDLFSMRVAHGAFVALALACLWRAGQRLALSQFSLYMAIAILMISPRFSFTSISFYGEMWLGVAVCLMLLFLSERKWLLVASLVGLAPLIRPEGVFFVVTFSFFFLKRRAWREFFIIFIPGLIYALYIIFSFFPDIYVYLNWRAELRGILNNLSGPASIPLHQGYSLFLLLPALAGVLCPSARVLWPISLASVLWVLFLVVLTVAGSATYEERYLYSIMPVMAILWASFFSWLDGFFDNRSVSFRIGVFFVACMVCVSHLSLIVPLRKSVEREGLFNTLSIIATGEAKEIFYRHTENVIKERRRAARIIYLLTKKDSEIDKIVIYDPFLYYFVDPAKVPSNIVFGYPATNNIAFQLLLDGQVFIQHPGKNMYSYLDFGKPDFQKNEKRLVYIDMMPIRGYPYTWELGSLPASVYIFSYVETSSPRIDLQSVEPISVDDIKNAYNLWFRRNADK